MASVVVGASIAGTQMTTYHVAQRLGTIALGGKPEYGVPDGHGKLYANIEDKAEVVEIDANSQKVTRRWSLAPCESPTGLAIDRVHRRLCSGCRNKHLAISDADKGKLIATLPIGARVDANAFDPGTQDAFASNGDGTFTVGTHGDGHRWRPARSLFSCWRNDTFGSAADG